MTDIQDTLPNTAPDTANIDSATPATPEVAANVTPETPELKETVFGDVITSIYNVYLLNKISHCSMFIKATLFIYSLYDYHRFQKTLIFFNTACKCRFG